MSDILIKGMEMPKNCSDCPLNYDQMMCIVTGTRWWSDTMVLIGFDSDKERLYDCPLIELPPHGRIKDESDIISLIEVMFCKDKDGMEHAIQCVKDAPTVIEAEGEKDGR